MTVDAEGQYRKHMSVVVNEGFALDPPGFERLSLWTHVLMHLVNARKNFEWVRDHPYHPGDEGKIFELHAFFVAGVMAYSRCYASSGPSIPKLDAKRVYAGSDDGMTVHRRLILLRNTIAAHTDQSDLVRVTLAVKEESESITIRHLTTIATPRNEIANFLEATAHTAHFVTVNLNRQLDRLATKFGKKVDLD